MIATLSSEGVTTLKESLLRFVPKKSFVTELVNAKLTFRKNEVEISGASDDVTVKKLIEAKSDGAGALIAPARTLAKILGNQEGETTLATSGKSLKVTSQNQSRSLVRLVESTDSFEGYHTMPDKPDKPIGTINLTNAFEQTHLALPRKEAMWTNLLAFFLTKDKMLTTNGSLLLLSDLSSPLNLDEGKVLALPPYLFDLTKNETEMELFKAKGNGIMLVSKKTTIFTRLATASLPQYQPILNTEVEHSITVPLKLLLEGLKITGATLSPPSNRLNLTYENNHLILETTNDEGTTRYQIPVEQSRNPLKEYAVSYKLLADALTPLQETLVTLGQTDSARLTHIKEGRYYALMAKMNKE